MPAVVVEQLRKSYGDHAVVGAEVPGHRDDP